jgi:EAL domain-containing protein (putative c-di-GMP-specific phosphodiesterase class I)
VLGEGIAPAELHAARRELRAGLGQGYFLGRPSAAAPKLARSAGTRRA